jgi:hypothetical protein
VNLWLQIKFEFPIFENERQQQINFPISKCEGTNSKMMVEVEEISQFLEFFLVW